MWRRQTHNTGVVWVAEGINVESQSGCAARTLKIIEPLNYRMMGGNTPWRSENNRIVGLEGILNVFQPHACCGLVAPHQVRLLGANLLWAPTGMGQLQLHWATHFETPRWTLLHLFSWASGLGAVRGDCKPRRSRGFKVMGFCEVQQRVDIMPTAKCWNMSQCSSPTGFWDRHRREYLGMRKVMEKKSHYTGILVQLKSPNQSPQCTYGDDIYLLLGDNLNVQKPLQWPHKPCPSELKKQGLDNSHYSTVFPLMLPSLYNANKEQNHVTWGSILSIRVHFPVMSSIFVTSAGFKRAPLHP